MTQPTGAVVDAPAPTTHAPVWRRRPSWPPHPDPAPAPGPHDGQPLRHLSNSSYTRFVLCPEDWRRHYIQGERTPPTGAMFLGSPRRRRRDRLLRPPARPRRAARARPGSRPLPRPLAPQLEAEQAKQGVTWVPDLPEPDAVPDRRGRARR